MIQLLHQLHDLRGADCSGLVPNLKTGFACGSMVHFLSLAQKNSHCEFFCAKDQGSFTLPEAQRSSGSVTA
jgi:hypothetical protein